MYTGVPNLSACARVRKASALALWLAVSAKTWPLAQTSATAVQMARRRVIEFPFLAGEVKPQG
jgi:hypothetical protein